MNLPRLMIAAPASGSGKTMLTLALLQALQDRGKKIVSMKCGPDYIDPMFHRSVLSVSTGNLDLFFTDKEEAARVLADGAAGADLAVLEGVMGLYDGLGGTSLRASTYEAACATKTPVVLVVNARGMSLSTAALIRGFVDYQKLAGDAVIRGVILNQAGKGLCERLKPVIEETTGIRVYGCLPRMPECAIADRHLGLVLPREIEGLQDRIRKMAQALEENTDVDGLLELAESAPPLQDPVARPSDPAVQETCIAVARDEAFCFYYRENLELLQRQGARLAFFSPLRDHALPEGTEGLLLGGGYPELYARQLSQNTRLLSEIRARLEGGLPCLAECGGFLYLHRKLQDADGNFWPMCGMIDGTARHTDHLQHFGYVTLSSGSGQLLPEGKTIRAHEFHYYESSAPGTDYTACRPSGGTPRTCMHGGVRLAAGFPHLYYPSEPSFTAAFLAQSRLYGRGCRT